MNKDDWQTAKTINGKIYYHNKITKISQWNDPFEDDKIWKVCKFNDGLYYYYNRITKKSQWKCPFDYKNIWSIGQFVDGRTYYYNRLTKISQWNCPKTEIGEPKYEFKILNPRPPLHPPTPNSSLVNPSKSSKYIFIPANNIKQ